MRNTTKKPPEVNRKNCADANEARLETPGGALVRKWDETTAVSRHAFLPHFASFLHAGGQFERLVETCPVRYTSPNAPTLNELLATAVAGIVLGLTRHAGRTELTLFVGGRPETKRPFRQIETAIESTATQLGPERRWRTLLLYAMRAYGPFPNAEPPLMGEQFTLALAFPDTG